MPSHDPVYRNLLTTPRQVLYDLVWSNPLSDVAAGYHVTESTLRERCRKVQVPLPSPDYRRRVERGESPERTPLAVHRTPSADDGGDATTESMIEMDASKAVIPRDELYALVRSIPMLLSAAR